MGNFNDTKYNNIAETLGAIGKRVFVDFYYDFKNPNISRDELTKKLIALNKSIKSEEQGFRIPRARHIFENNQQIEALEIIISSTRLDVETISRAKTILSNELKLKEKVKVDITDESNFVEVLNNNFDTSSVKKEYDNSPKAPKVKSKVTTSVYNRDRKVALNALAHADYKCEYEPSHQTFTRKNSDVPYTEPHHLVPLSASKDFPNIDLDREQNIVSLCSNCHNWIHYGANNETILRKLFDERKDGLKSIGIDITFEGLMKYYL